MEYQPRGALSNNLVNWLARRRIAISLVGFTSLVLVNIFVIRHIPMNPLDVAQPWTACALSLILVGLVIRGWSAGTLNKSRELTQHGPYAVVRNPLYLGSFLMMLGFCILCRDALTLAFVAGPMAVLYWNQIHFEERRLAGMFPEQWQSYVRRVPRLIPQLSARGVIGGWEWAQWKRNREYQAVLASTLGLFGIYAWHWFVVN